MLPLITLDIRTTRSTPDGDAYNYYNRYDYDVNCLNEMGAVWAYDTNVRYYILPNTDFSEIGWLTNPKQAESIISRTALDALQKELIESFGLTDKGLGWSRNRDKFVRSIEQISVKQ